LAMKVRANVDEGAGTQLGFDSREIAPRPPDMLLLHVDDADEYPAPLMQMNKTRLVRA
jgi:hypothetical protein